ncbi:protein yellow-like [Rhodnius prolixus]|uniref:protein yellow-like n=1 Tax=Rhodnius prolixus TaxID=13249 RepID=UPI003D18BED0
MRVLGLFLLTYVLMSKNAADNRFKEKYSWEIIDYEFPSLEERAKAEAEGLYKPGNSFISSIDLWGDFLYLAVPRMKPGVPSTLNYINISDPMKSPILKPYPSWEANYFNNTAKKQGMTSVHSLRVDVCNRLWAIDSGLSDELNTNREENLPSLFVYNLIDRSLVRKYILVDEQFYRDSKFRNIVVDVTPGNCENAFAYLADTQHGLLVYRWYTNESHKISNNYFSFEPIWGSFRTSTGNLYQLNDGVLGMALSMPNQEGHRELFFQPLAGILVYRISTRILQNKSMPAECYKHTYLLGNRGDNMQSSASIFDQNTGTLFYTTVIKNGIACWNSFRGDNINPQNQGIINEFNEPLSYPADIRIDKNGSLWVLTNKMMDFLYEKEQSTTPYRIFTGTLHTLIKNTPCKLF